MLEREQPVTLAHFPTRIFYPSLENSSVLVSRESPEKLMEFDWLMNFSATQMYFLNLFFFFFRNLSSYENVKLSCSHWQNPENCKLGLLCFLCVVPEVPADPEDSKKHSQEKKKKKHL